MNLNVFQHAAKFLVPLQPVAVLPTPINQFKCLSKYCL